MEIFFQAPVTGRLKCFATVPVAAAHNCFYKCAKSALSSLAEIC